MAKAVTTMPASPAVTWNSSLTSGTSGSPTRMVAAETNDAAARKAIERTGTAVASAGCAWIIAASWPGSGRSSSVAGAGLPIRGRAVL